MLSIASASLARTTVDEHAYEDAVLSPGTLNEVTFSLPRRGLQVEDLLIVYNANQPESVAIKDCYVARRNVPVSNILAVNAPTNADIPQSSAVLIRDAIDAALVGRDDIQAVAFAWRTPWRVDVPTGPSSSTKRSITTFLGRLTDSANLLYDSASTRPWGEYGVRPMMLITPEIDDTLPAPGVVCDETGLIARGVQADGSLPVGNGYLLRTSDFLRSVRYEDFLDTVDLFDDTVIQLEYRDLQSGPDDVVISNSTITSLEELENTGDFISGESDVMFHFTGLATVPGISTNTFLPGSFADHLTSGAGAITFRRGEFFDCEPEPCDPPTYASTQMSALNWLENGATASFGNVAEPFANTNRFPNSRPLVENYLYGGTLLESVAKSVLDPVFGLPVGEPLARAFSWRDASAGGDPAIETAALRPGSVYSVWTGADERSELARSRSNLVVSGPQITEIRGAADAGFVLLQEEPDPFFIQELARSEFIACSLQTPDGAAWCDENGQLWYSANGGDRQLIGQNVLTRNVAVDGNTLFWLGTTSNSGVFELFSQELTSATPTLLAQVSADTPVNLVATDAIIVWADAIIFAFPEVAVFDRATGQVFTQPTGSIDVWPSNQIAADGDTIAFVGQDLGTGQSGIFAAAAGQLPALLVDVPNTSTNLDMDASWVVWSVDDGVFANDYASASLTRQLGDPWQLGGAVAWLDLNDGAVGVLQTSGEQRRLWLEELDTQATLLLPSAASEQLKGTQRNSTDGSIQAKYLVTSYVPGGGELIDFDSRPFEIALGYDPSAVTAIHDSVVDISVPSGQSAAFYFRPSSDFLRLGQFEYSLRLTDDSDLGASGLSFDVSMLGDLNQDGAVNFLDYGAWTAAFPSAAGDANYDPAADFDNSGSVNFLDAFTIIDNFLDPDTADVAFVQWDTSGLVSGQSLALELTITANQGAALKKTLVLTVE